jgi:hypothetical protein
MEILGKEQKEQKEQYDFFCEKCNFKCCKKFNWHRHLTTSKHNESNIGKEKKEQKEQKEQKENIYICKCGKTYRNASGLWKHKQKCNVDINNNCWNENSNTISNNKIDKDELIITLLKQNAELLEIVKNGTHNITHTNSHNKSFNLQFFLNETCKNAMNITDFVNSIKLQLCDLERVGELGYVEGISNIIIKNLNALDITERPIHCTDKKRETMYIKDENKWEKEDDNNTKLHKMVRKVSNKNIDLISEFKELNPEWKKSTSKVSDQFDKIIIESMGGKGENDYEKEEKIIKKVAKAVFIDKVL